jgi:ATP-dependent RNA helicase RhlB
MKFTEFDLSPEILKGIEEVGFTDCTQVQEETYKHAFAGKDVCVQSQTGTGKTAAYLITIYKLFLDNLVKNKRALILVPTRELAVQIEAETGVLGKYLPFKAASFYGGVGYHQQEAALAKGVDIMIATPGRLIDLFKSGKITLSDVSILVIDEADRMFDMGFIPDIRYLIKKMPGSDERKTMLFSATLSQKVKGLAWEYMKDAVEVDIMPENLTVDKITQSLYHVGTDEKFRLLLGILKKYNPQNAIIFTNMKRIAEILSKKLAINGYPNEYIMGDLPQKKRLKVIEGIKTGEIRFLVATDVAARGLHVDDLEIVINYDLPEDCENYVHRIGRTARAGKTGLAVSLACEKYVQALEGIESYISMKIPVESFEESMLVEDASAGIGFGGGARGRGGRDGGRRDSRDGGPRAHGRDGGRRDGKDGGRGDRPQQHRGGRPERSDDQLSGKKFIRKEDGVPEHLRAKPEQRHISNKPVITHAGEHQKAHHPFPKQGGGKFDRKRDNRNDKRGPARPERQPFTSSSAPRRDGSLEERMAYYRQKYGENFKVSDELLRNEKMRKKSLWQKVKSIFSK